jgi:hypothetical protein
MISSGVSESCPQVELQTIYFLFKYIFVKRKVLPAIFLLKLLKEHLNKFESKEC